MCEFVFACVFVCEGRISLINSCNLGSVALTLPPLTRRLSAAPTSAIGRVQHLVLFSGGNLTAFDPAPVFAAILLPILPTLLFTFPHYWELGIKCRNWKVVDESTFRNVRLWVKPWPKDSIKCEVYKRQQFCVSMKRTNTSSDWGRVHWTGRDGPLEFELDGTSEGVVPTSQLVTDATSDTGLSSSASSHCSNKDFSKVFLQDISLFSHTFLLRIILL